MARPVVLDDKGRVIFGYVDNNKQIVEMKIPLKGVEIDRVATSRPPSVSIPIDGVKANNFIRQISQASDQEKSLSFRALTNSVA